MGVIALLLVEVAGLGEIAMAVFFLVMDGEADALNWTDLRPRPIRLIIRKEPIFPNHRHIAVLPFDDGAV